MLSHCPASIRPIIALLVGTGLRIDEALHLRWDDVDIDHRLLHVHRGRQGTTKSGQARGVPLFDSVMPVLCELKLKRGENVLVFPSPIGGRLGAKIAAPERVRSKVGVSKPFKLAVIAAGLPAKLRPHDLRHSFAIQYLHDGGDLHRLSRILGHSTVITDRALLPRVQAGRVRHGLRARTVRDAERWQGARVRCGTVSPQAPRATTRRSCRRAGTTTCTREPGAYAGKRSRTWCTVCPAWSTY